MRRISRDTKRTKKNGKVEWSARVRRILRGRNWEGLVGLETEEIEGMMKFFFFFFFLFFLERKVPG
jgi:hypothetical protein